MNKVAIVVDSTADLTRDLYEKHKIIVVPLLVNIGGESYEDGTGINSEKLYSLVAEHNELPTTAAVSPQKFIETFKPLIEEGYDIFFVGIGSLLSATLQSVILASQEFPKDRIFYTDSNNLSSASGLLALKAVKYRDEGKSAKEIKELIDKLAPKLNTVFAIETLDYLHKGGRASGTAKIIGKIFRIHPLIKVVNGKLIVYKKPRGRMNVALDELIAEIQGDLPSVDLERVMITHSGADQENLEYFKEKLSQIIEPDSICVTQAGAVISSHCGYGTIGILYIRKQK